MLISHFPFVLFFEPLDEELGLDPDADEPAGADELPVEWLGAESFDEDPRFCEVDFFRPETC